MVNLEWSKLLSESRERKSATNKSTKIDEFDHDHRNEFDKDYDRIVYSSSLRRLQDKAQVFPLQENDFTRTRLTHSIEVSALARSLGNAIGEWLFEKGYFKDVKQIGKLSSMLQVAGLVHDLGNPPFGHYGESIIRNWFKKLFNNEEFNELNNKYGERKLTDKQKKDFLFFEGNAQTLRIISKLQILNDIYGLNFTYGSLATIMKYTWSSKSEKTKSKEKFGYFLSEKQLVENIFNETGISEGIKHPATYLLEAADDIAYLNADIEDAVKKGIIPWKKEYDNIKENLKNCPNYKMYNDKIFKPIEKNKSNGIYDDDLIAIQNFKVFSQGLMFKSVIKSFKDNYSKIMNGEYSDENLLNNSNCSDLVDELKRIAREYCFSNKEVISLELVGDSVINGLLDKLVNPIIKEPNKEPEGNIYEAKIYSLFSNNFKNVFLYDCINKKKRNYSETSMYDRLLLVTDYISGMTDSYAVNLYKELLGFKLP